MIKAAIILLTSWLLVRSSNFIFIHFERLDHSPNKYSLNIYKDDTVNSSRKSKEHLTNLVLAMITLVLGAFSGAIASEILKKPKEKDLADAKDATFWLISSLISAPGALTLLAAILLILEIIGIYLILRISSNKNNKYLLDQLYSSLQKNELSPLNFGEDYRSKVNAELPNIFNKHPLVKIYESVESIDLKYFKLNRLILSKTILLISIPSLLIIGFFHELEIYQQQAPSLIVALGFILYCKTSSKLWEIDEKIEKFLQRKRKKQIQEFYNILQRKYDYVSQNFKQTVPQV